MANEILENIWKIMKENKFQYVDQINNDLICNICNKLMIKACNVPCGCRYCFDCITNYLNAKEKFCPGKNKFCQMKTINHENDIGIDYATNVRILEVVVKCPIKNCEFTDELSLIENHMRTCDKNSTSCPYYEIGCKNDEVIIDEIKDHLCSEIFCHTKLLLDFINNLQNEMESIKNEIADLKLENNHLKEELEIIKIDSKDNQMKNEEFEKKIKNNLSEIEELNEEMVVIKNENRSMMNKLENIEKSRVTFEKNEVIERMQRKSEQQTREIDEMKEKCEQTENKEIEIRRIIDEKFDKIDSDLMKKSNINNYDEKINNLQIKIIKMERFTEIINNFGEFEWKIEKLLKQLQKTNTYSKSFYSHQYGYKMCLSGMIIDYFWIGGSFCVDVCFHLMRGEFDNDLSWPFEHGVTIDIINQMDGTVYTSKSIKYDDYPNEKGWNKPTTERNEGIIFITINKEDEIIRNDDLLIKCKINI